MSSNISFNPLLTTNGLGSFSVQSDGYVQGIALDDPAIRNSLAGGVLLTTESLPMWGGVGIGEFLPASTSDGALGSGIGRALTLAGLTGFSVFNQAHNWVTSPQSQVPSAGAGMTVPFYRFGSGARIAVAIDPALVSLDTGLVTQQVSWDFALQRLVPYAPVEPANVLTAAAWSAGVVSVTTTAAHGYVTGNDVTISGNTPSGYNGTFKITKTGASTFTYPLAVDPGANTVLGQVDAGGGALPVQVLQLNIGNSKTVSYDAVNNLVNWNNSGSTAIILI